MTTKIDLARDYYNEEAAARKRLAVSCEFKTANGKVLPCPHFRASVISIIIKEFKTTRQNAGTYFSRIWREQHGGTKPPIKKRRRPSGAAKLEPISAAARKRAQDAGISPETQAALQKRSGSHSQDIDEQDMGTGFLENLDITPAGDIQAPIQRIDKPMAIYLGNEAMELLKVLEEYHGLDISRSKSKFVDGCYQMDIRFSVKDSEGNSQTPEAQDFLDYAISHEIPKEFLFKEFEVDGKTLCIIGWKRRASKNKVLFLKDGKRYVTRVSSMQRYLRKAGLIDG